MFFHLDFGFGVILKNPSTRGPHSTLEVSLEHFSSHIRFVSLLIPFIIMDVIDMISIDLWVVMSS